MRRFVTAAIAVTAVLFLMLSEAAWSQGRPGGGGSARGPIPVSAYTVEKKDFAEVVEALGTMRANETVALTAKITQVVKEVLFDDGQVVKKDDVLIILDSAEEAANLQSAQAQAAERRSAYKRAAGLEEKQIVSRATYEERQAQLRQAEADIKSIQSRLADTVIKAPFDGILGLRNVSVGALVRPGDSITSIDDLSRMKVDFDIPAVYLQQLRPGLKVTGKVEGFGDRLFEGVVSTVDTQVDPVTRAVKVRAIVPNGDLSLRPGLLMSVTLDVNPRQAMVVPEISLIQQRDRNYVFVAREEDGKVTARRVEIERGSRRLGEVEILSGLEEGQKVLTTGLMAITDGAEVSLQEKP